MGDFWKRVFGKTRTELKDEVDAHTTPKRPSFLSYILHKFGRSVGVVIAFAYFTPLLMVYGKNSEGHASVWAGGFVSFMAYSITSGFILLATNTIYTTPIPFEILIAINGGIPLLQAIIASIILEYSNWKRRRWIDG